MPLHMQIDGPQTITPNFLKSGGLQLRSGQSQSQFEETAFRKPWCGRALRAPGRPLGMRGAGPPPAQHPAQPRDPASSLAVRNPVWGPGHQPGVCSTFRRRLLTGGVLVLHTFPPSSLESPGWQGPQPSSGGPSGTPKGGRARGTDCLPLGAGVALSPAAVCTPEPRQDLRVLPAGGPQGRQWPVRLRVQISPDACGGLQGSPRVRGQAYPMASLRTYSGDGVKVFQD